MNEKLEWKPGTLLAPIPPAMVSCGTMEQPNIITIAWTGIVNTIPPVTYISIRPERHSYNIIKDSGEFIINLTTSKLVRAADWCGARSGAKFDKFKEMGLTPQKLNNVSCPAIMESPINLECKVRDIIQIGSHDMFLADIISVNVSPELLDDTGKLCMEKAGIAAFMHGEYFELGKSLGGFGFSVRKPVKPVKKKKNHPQKQNPRKDG